MIRGQVTGQADHQTLTIELPPSVHIEGSEVLFQTGSQDGRLVLTQLSPARETNWQDVFDAFDAAEIPDDFLEDRDMSPPQERQGW